MKRKAKKRLKLTKNYVICQTKRHHLAQYYSRIALNPHEEAKAGENDKFKKKLNKSRKPSKKILKS